MALEVDVKHGVSSVCRSISPTCVHVCVCDCRSVDSPLALLPDAAALEEEVSDGQNWQDTVPPQLLATLSPREVDRQAVIYGTGQMRQNCTSTADVYLGL